MARGSSRSRSKLPEDLREAPGGLNRRDFLVRAGATAAAAPSLGAILAACGGTSTGSLKPLRLAYSADTWPAQGTGAASTTYQYPLNVNVFDTLIRMNDT
ncbi:MAG: hypothetical protein ACREQ5_39045, partial [Candidatus Dormibacteria bacterium]